jgi:predicted small secreted protein
MQVQKAMMTQFLERKRRKMFKLGLKNKREVEIVKRTKSKMMKRQKSYSKMKKLKWKKFNRKLLLQRCPKL